MYPLISLEEFKDIYQTEEVSEFKNNVKYSVPKPLVSVRIITYQHVNYIQKAIDSVLMQNVNFPYEIIIGDDESTDGTREICIEYAKKYPNLIRLFLHKRSNNRKLFGRPTHLFQFYYNNFHLRGEYVAGCSGDDYWTDPFKLQKQVDALEKNSGLALVHHKWAKMDMLSGQIKVVDNPNHARIQTVLGLNIFHQIPKFAMDIIQEDNLSRHIWSLKGKSLFIENIKPSIRREETDNMFHAIDSGLRLKHKINYLETTNKYLSRTLPLKEKIRRNKLLIKYYLSEVQYLISRNQYLNLSVSDFLNITANLLYNIPKSACTWFFLLGTLSLRGHKAQ